LAIPQRKTAHLSGHATEVRTPSGDPTGEGPGL